MTTDTGLQEESKCYDAENVFIYLFIYTAPSKLSLYQFKYLNITCIFSTITH